MNPWRNLTAADRRAIVAQTRRRYSSKLGRVIAARRAARLREGRPLTDVELQNEVTLAAAGYIGNGLAPEVAWMVAEQERDVHRFQAENWDRVRVATEGEKDEVLRWLNDNEPDMLRLAMDEAER